MPTTVVHLKRSSYDIRIDRRTPWGNPYRLTDESERPLVIEQYRQWVETSSSPGAQWIRDHVHELRGKRLGCWCAPKPCHGDILAQLADRGTMTDKEELPTVHTIHPDGSEHDEVLRTKTGKIITPADIDNWVADAEEGYEIHQFMEQPGSLECGQQLIDDAGNQKTCGRPRQQHINPANRRPLFGPWGE